MRHSSTLEKSGGINPYNFSKSDRTYHSTNSQNILVVQTSHCNIFTYYLQAYLILITLKNLFVCLTVTNLKIR